MQLGRELRVYENHRRKSDVFRSLLREFRHKSYENVALITRVDNDNFATERAWAIFPKRYTFQQFPRGNLFFTIFHKLNVCRYFLIIFSNDDDTLPFLFAQAQFRRRKRDLAPPIFISDPPANVLIYSFLV